jgi:hypothetical protein
MPLPPNPLAQLVTAAASSVESFTASAKSAAGALPTDIKEIGGSITSATEGAKAGLDKLVAQGGGGIGSALNGMTAGASSAFGAAGSALSGASGALGGAFADVTGKVQGALGGAGGIAGAVGGIAGTVGGLAGSISNIAAGAGDALNKITGGIASAGGLGSGLLSAARNISAAAGQINNLLSLFRGKNIPSGADLFSQVGAQVKITPVQQSDWRVRINCDFDTLFGANTFSRLKATSGVVWPYLPNITLSTKANYTQVDPTHNNFPFQSYKNSQVEDIQISGEFSCETEADAAYWIAATTFFRTATKMFYGQGQYAGNPPVICQLTGYGANIFNSVPVIIKSFSVDLKDDVNYVQCNAYGSATWVPIMSTISVTVAPIYNRERLRKFSLQNFARGKEVGMI